MLLDEAVCQSRKTTPATLTLNAPTVTMAGLEGDAVRSNPAGSRPSRNVRYAPLSRPWRASDTMCQTRTCSDIARRSHEARLPTPTESPLLYPQTQLPNRDVTGRLRGVADHSQVFDSLFANCADAADFGVSLQPWRLAALPRCCRTTNQDRFVTQCRPQLTMVSSISQGD